QQVGEIALRIDGEHGHAVDRRLLDEPDPEPRLAAARHADAHGVGDEILRVVEHEIGPPRARGEVLLSSEIEDAQLLVVRRHGPHHISAEWAEWAEWAENEKRDN